MKSVATSSSGAELAVRRHLHAYGLRFTLHAADLPGRPDIVLPGRRAVVFVHGCFWHGHNCRHGRVKARTNADYWTAKIADNRARDRRQVRTLRATGWTVEVVWECQCNDAHRLDTLAAKLSALPQRRHR